MALGVFYLEFGRYQQALEIFESMINIVQTEITLRINRSKETANNFAQAHKFKSTVKT